MKYRVLVNLSLVLLVLQISTEMAASLPPETAARLRWMRASTLLNECANCFIFHYEQMKPESLQKCGRCKVVEYCSKECQAEHWAMLHKAQCKQMAWARQSEKAGKEPVGIYSQHPFPDPEASLQSGTADTTEVLVDVVQKVLVRLKSRDPTLFLRIEQLPQLEAIMEMNRMRIWRDKKIFPQQYRALNIDHGCSPEHPLFYKSMVTWQKDEAGLNIWSTLYLVWGRLVEHMVTVLMSILKDARQALPVDAWRISSRMTLVSFLPD